MTEDQKHWTISEPKSSKKCEWKVPVAPDITNGTYNNFGEVKCNHKLGGQRCCIKNKMLCPIRTIEVEYPMNPKLQVNKDDV